MKISPKFRKGRLRTRVVRNIETVPPAAWNKIFPPVPENYYFLKTLDESKFDQFSFFYILIYEGRELVGAAPCFGLNYSLDTSINGPLRRLTNAVKRIFPYIFSVKALVCGIPMGQGQIGLGGSDRGAVLRAVAMRLEAMARKQKAPFIAFKDFDSSYDAVFKPLLADRFVRPDSLPMTRMKLDFKNFEEYLKTLSSATRYDMRRKFKRIAEAKIDLNIEQSIDEGTLNEVYALYLHAVEIHEMGFEIVPKDFFRLAAKNMPDDTRFFLWRINGKLVAFAFCLVSGDVLLDYYLGFDPGAAHQYHLFFVRAKALIEYGLKHGLKTFEMGTTGYEPKRRLRFDFVPVYLYVKILPQMLYPVLKLLCTLLKFENFDPVIKQWKKAKQ